MRSNIYIKVVRFSSIYTFSYPPPRALGGALSEGVRFLFSFLLGECTIVPPHAVSGKIVPPRELSGEGGTLGGGTTVGGTSVP